METDQLLLLQIRLVPMAGLFKKKQKQYVLICAAVTFSFALHAVLLAMARNEASISENKIRFSECTSHIANFIVTNSPSSPFFQKTVVLGGSSDLNSHVAPNYFFRNALSNLSSKSTGKGMVEIAKTNFVYEVPNPMYRYWLYMIGISDTTILPFELAHRALSKQNTSLFLMWIEPENPHANQRVNSSKWPLLKTSLRQLKEYMLSNYSNHDFYSRTCN